MSVTIPIVAADGAQSTVTLAAPVVASSLPSFVGKTGRGTYIQDSLLWGANASAASYQYLAAQGVNVVRVSFPWENLQPTLGGAFTATGRYSIAIITTELNNAAAAGIKLWLTPMNQGKYNGVSFGAPGGPTTAQFGNFWTRMATAFGTHPGLAGWDLMNEPNGVYPDSASANTRAGAVTWETYSQAAVSALRNAGDTNWIHCEGYSWSEATNWAALHPAAWINDPAHKTIYSTHMYPAYTYLKSGGVNGVDLSYSYWAAHLGGGNFPAWVLSRLQVFINWLHANNLTTGDLGETSWPSSWAMIVCNNLSASTAASEAALWNANIGHPLMTLCDNNNLSVTTQGAGGWAVDVPDRELMFFNHGAGNGETMGANGIPVIYTLDTTLSNWPVMAAHLNR